MLAELVQIGILSLVVYGAIWLLEQAWLAAVTWWDGV